MVHNSGITKKTKVQFFNSHVLSQLANLYQYTKDAEEGNSEEQKSDPTVRQKVHDLLLKVCGSFKFGICFSNVAGAFAARYIMLYIHVVLVNLMSDWICQNIPTGTRHSTQ